MTEHVHDMPAHAVSAIAQSFHSPTPHKRVSKGNALDLFSGTGSVAKWLRELGYNVVYLDMDPRKGAILRTDLLAWDYMSFPAGYFKIKAASVPCAEYSSAKTTGPRNFENADTWLYGVLDIIDYLQPQI